RLVSDWSSDVCSSDLYALVFGGIAFLHRQRLSPVLPVVVSQEHGDGRANRMSMPYAAQNVCRVALDLHAAAAPVTLLAAPQFAVDELEIDCQPRRHTGEQRDQRFSMGFTGCGKS